MRESDLSRLILIAASDAGHRLFRCNTAQGWAGAVVNRTPDTVTLRNPRPLFAGLINGGADLIGWTRAGLFAAIEVKGPGGRSTDAQVRFVQAVKMAGGRACVAYSVEEAMACLNS